MGYANRKLWLAISICICTRQVRGVCGGKVMVIILFFVTISWKVAGALLCCGEYRFQGFHTLRRLHV